MSIIRDDIFLKDVISFVDLHRPDLDIPEPCVIAMVLQPDVAFLRHIGPVFIQFREFTSGNQFIPFRCPEMILEHSFSILFMNDRSFIDNDLNRIPFTCRFGILGLLPGSGHTMNPTVCCRPCPAWHRDVVRYPVPAFRELFSR
jgi:hypothetical protein